MTGSLSSPDQRPRPAEDLSGKVVVPSEGAPPREIIAALTAALIAGAGAAMISTILSRFTDLTKHIARIIIDAMPWENLLRVTADEIALLPHDDTATVRVLHTVATQNAFRRAVYIINAVRRLAPAFRARGEGADERRQRAIAAETRWLEAHEEAERKRNSAGRRIAEAVSGSRPDEQGEVLLGWYATIDNRTSRDCRQADGKNFDALIPPPIGYPGTVHLHCRCLPGVPHKTTLRVEDVEPDHG